MLKRIICGIICGLITLTPIAEARRYRVRTHTRHYRNGKVVRIGSYTRTSKNK